MEAKSVYIISKKLFAKLKPLIGTTINLLIMPIGACGIYTLFNYYERHKQHLNSTIWLILLIIGFIVLLFAFNNKTKPNQYQ